MIATLARGEGPGPVSAVAPLGVAELRIVTATPPSVSEDTPGVVVWRDRHRVPVAFGLDAGAFSWLIVRGVGAYRFPRSPADPNLVVVEVTPEPGVSFEDLDDYFLRTVMPVAVQPHGFEALHASAVAFEGIGVVVFCADSRTGKSTLAYALAERGARQVADDFVVFDPRTVMAFPVPFAPRLRRASAESLGAPRRGSVRATSRGWSRRLDEALPIAAVFLLERGAHETQLQRVSGAEVLGRLLTDAFVDSINDPARKRTLVEAYLRLKAAAPVFRLSFRDGLEELPRVCEHVENWASDRALEAATRS